MNIGSFIGLVLLVGVAFLGFNTIIEDFEKNLIDTGYTNNQHFNDSYTTDFDQSSDISANFSDSISQLQELGDSGNWWEELGDFIGAIPIILISIPGIIFSTLFGAIGGLTTILNKMGIPPEIVGIVGLVIVIWIVFKLINFWKSGSKV